MRNGKSNTYPQPIAPSGYELHEDARGLTKREYFAVCAMQGILSANTDLAQVPKVSTLWAVDLADELLAALDAKNG